MKRSGVLAVSASLAIALGACGGGSEEPATEDTSTTEDYASEVQAPLSDAEDAVSGLDDITTTSQYSDDVEAFEDAEEALSDLVNDLESAEPPSEAESAQEDLVSASEDLSEELAAGVESAENETTDDYPEGYPEEFDAVEEWEDAREEFEQAVGG